MIRFSPSPFRSQSRLPEVRRGGFALARRELLKTGGFAIGATVLAALAGCAAGDGQSPVRVREPASTGFFTDGSDFVD